MAYMTINRNGTDFNKETADQINQMVDQIDKKIDNFPNYTKEWHVDNIAPIAINGVLSNSSFRKGQSIILNISFNVNKGTTGSLNISIQQLKGISYQCWTSCRSEKGYIYPILIKAGKIYSPVEIAEDDVIYMYQIVILA